MPHINGGGGAAGASGDARRLHWHHHWQPDWQPDWQLDWHLDWKLDWHPRLRDDDYSAMREVSERAQLEA